MAKFTEKDKMAVVKKIMEKSDSMTKKEFVSEVGVHPDTLRKWEKKYSEMVEESSEKPVSTTRKNMKKFVVYTVDELENVEYVMPNFEHKKQMTDDKEKAYVFKYEKTVLKYVDMLGKTNPHKTCMFEKLN